MWQPPNGEFRRLEQSMNQIDALKSTQADELQVDLLGEPLCRPSSELLEALKTPDLVQKIAQIRLMRKFSIALRENAPSVGWTILMDGLPAIFPTKSGHPRRKALAALAGLIDHDELEAVAELRPTEEAIQSEMKNQAASFARRLKHGFRMLDSIIDGI